MAMSPSGLTPFARAEEGLLLDAVPHALVLSDRGGRIILANSLVESLFGYGREELVGRTVKLLMPAVLRSRDSGRLAGYWSSRLKGTFELLGRRKDGSLFPIEVTISSLDLHGRSFVWNSIRARSGTKHPTAAEVRASHELRLKLAMDAGGIGTFDWDLDTGKIKWDKHQECFFGFAPGEFDGSYASLEERVHPDDFAALNRAVETARHTHSTFTQEFRVVWPDGGIHWILGRGEFLYDDTGQAIRMLGALVRLDERRRAEQALKRVEERYRNVLDSLLEGCSLIDFHWMFLYVNEAAARHSLRPGEDLVGRSLLEVYPGIERCEAFAHYRRCMEERLPQHFEEAVSLPDGTTRWYELSVVPVPEGIFVLTLDVTDRAQAEKDLRKNEERLRQAVRVSSLGIFDHDHSSDFVYWSPEQYAMYGLAPQTPITVSRYLASVHPEDRERIAAAVRQAHNPAGDGFFDVEHRLVRPDGSVRWTNIRSQTFFEGEGAERHPVRTVGAATDITDRKHAEADKARLEARLFQAQKMESIGRLAGGVAHDFNNLLTVINGYTDLLLKRLEVSDLSRSPLNEIKKAGLRASELTQQLLAFGRQQITVPKVLNLNHVIRDLENLLRRLIGEDIVLVTLLNPELGQVMADPGQICQVLMNLAANSRDAMPHGGRLKIETANIDLDDRFACEHPEAKPGPYVLLTVSDSGAGMDSDTRDHIFEPFFTTKRVGKGTGLGLATVYGAIQQAGGFIRVCSELGQGSEFKIYLHRVEETIEAEEIQRRKPGKWQGTETILLVEDQLELRNLARTILESYGYRVVEAANGDEALERSEQWSGHIHLLLTDVIMPGLSGWDLANRLKSQRPQMKVIYMSGYSPTSTLREIQDAGIDFLQKPMSPDELVSKVREVLER